MPELVTEERDGYFYAALIEGKAIVDLAVDRIGETRLYHSIWRGRIDRIVPKVGAFTSIGARTGLFRDGNRTSGDSVIAQIKSVRSEGKADILTDDVSLGGKYFVYLPHDEKIRTSRKIDPTAAYLVITALEDAGINSGIVRAGALAAPVESVVSEAKALCEGWRALTETSTMGLLQDGPSAGERLMQDYPQHNLIAASDSFDARGVAEQLSALSQRQIKLPSGGTIVIERTAALTAIDVNSGTAAPATADREALALIATQIRLRNLSGLIVIDFTAKGNPDALLESVRRATANDPAGTRVAGFSPSGMVELIRPGRDLPLAEKLARIAT